MKMPRWKRHGGKDFVFADPHPGFVEGDAANEFRGSFCAGLHDSIQLVVDRCVGCQGGDQP